MDLSQDFNDVLTAAVRNTGVELSKATAEVANYTALRAAHLSTIVGQVGFDEAVAAERDNVALFAGIAAVTEAKAADSRLLGLIEGILFIGARALAAGL